MAGACVDSAARQRSAAQWLRVPVLGLLGLLWCLLAAAVLPEPPLSGHVLDQTATLSAAQREALQARLQQLEADTGSQLSVLIIPSTEGEPIEQYALRVAEAWKLGRQRIDDGAIVVVAKDDRAVRLEVGYGLEGALNDATAQRIISDTMLPRFRQQDFAGGLEAGLTQIIGVVRGEPLPPPGRRSATGGWRALEQWAPLLLFLALGLGGLLRAWVGRLPGAMLTGALVALATWLLMGLVAVSVLTGAAALLFNLLGGGMGGWGGGMGGGMGGMGGGLRGGGGGFGGGGASGRW